MYIYKNICISSSKSNVGRNIQSKSLLMAKRERPVMIFCPSITVNPLIHPPSFQLFFLPSTNSFAGSYDNHNDE